MCHIFICFVHFVFFSIVFTIDFHPCGNLATSKYTKHSFILPHICLSTENQFWFYSVLHLYKHPAPPHITTNRSICKNVWPESFASLPGSAKLKTANSLDELLQLLPTNAPKNILWLTFSATTEIALPGRQVEFTHKAKHSKAAPKQILNKLELRYNKSKNGKRIRQNNDTIK